jgi:hypothetical protein
MGSFRLYYDLPVSASMCPPVNSLEREEGTPTWMLLTEIYILYADCALKDPFMNWKCPFEVIPVYLNRGCLDGAAEKASSGSSKR